MRMMFCLMPFIGIDQNVHEISQNSHVLHLAKGPLSAHMNFTREVSLALKAPAEFMQWRKPLFPAFTK